ncbi:cytidine deaminase [bacterium]|nr:cytidine deaminase [bacterium]
MAKRKRFDLQPQKLTAQGVLPPGERDLLDALHRFESTGLLGLKTAAVAALATAGQPLTGILQSGRRLVTEHLGQFLKGASFVPAQQAREIAKRLELTTPQLMQELIPIARDRARASISHYRVGVVAQGVSGDFYLGFNIEFPEMPLVQTVNAEVCAVINALSHGERGLRSIAGTNPPSGPVRQFLYELPIGGELKVMLPDRTLKLKALLPYSFGPREMGQEGALMNSQRHNLELLESSRDPVVEHALEAACRAYAPYSHCPSGIALATDDQSFVGSYCENAAFNPSLSPLQGAIISLFAHGRKANEVRRAVLVERHRVNSEQIHQAASSKLLLSALCPDATFECHSARVLSH